MLHKELRYNVTVSVTKTSFSIHRVLHWAARKTVAHCIYEAYLNLKRKLKKLTTVIDIGIVLPLDDSAF